MDKLWSLTAALLGTKKMNLQKLEDELRAYYAAHSYAQLPEGYKHPIWIKLDEYAVTHPGLSAVQLKAAQYEVIAENFQPVVFKKSPFYSEMGVKPSENWGTPGSNAGGWLFTRNAHLFIDFNPEDYEEYAAGGGVNAIHLTYGPYADHDHHCFSSSIVIKHGLERIYNKARKAESLCQNKEESEFIDAAKRGLLAVKKISEKFAMAASEMLKDAKNDDERRFLSMIAETAMEVPWRKPKTFYEGLNTLWFLREVSGSLEGIGIDVIGHPDRVLIDLYQDDIASERITKDEAFDLVCRFLLPTDCKYDSHRQVEMKTGLAQELATVLMLGGCDAEGKEVCNELTFMFLKAHHELKLIFPKLLCRFNKSSSQDYLDAINRDFLSGRSVISLFNDDCIIPAQVRAGKKLEDARTYVAGGCWEVMLEGHEHSAGANCYFNLPRIIDMSIHDHPEMANTKIVCERLDGAADFEEVYRRLFANAIRAIRRMCELIGKNGSVWPEVCPSPFFSSCMADCLENRKDYTAGGGRYNPHALPLAGFANMVDSLLVIRKLCFERKRCSLDKLLEAVRANWQGFENLRAEVLTMPHFGDNTPEANALAQRLHDDFFEQTRDLKNERGGQFQLAYYVYREIVDWGKKTLATPDGRYSGDVFAHGVTPSRLHYISNVTSTINSVSALDLSKCPANACLDINMPLGELNIQLLAQFERAFAASCLPLLQLNCIDKAQLLEARKHPEKYQDLIVRICGYSARFVALQPEWQEEFIKRNLYE